MTISGPEAEVMALRRRLRGQANPGTVTIRNFHEGVLTTLGAELLPWRDRDAPNNPHWFIRIPGIDASAANLPGVPIFFSYPEDVFQKYAIPLIMLRFDGMDSAMQRWHPGAGSFRIPAPGAQIVSLGPPIQYDRYLTQQQPAPYDFNYTIVVEARNRGVAGGQRNQVLLIQQHVMSVYQPHSFILLLDSVGDTRTYYAEAGNVSPEDEIFDVADRTIGFTMPLRVEGELDLQPPFEEVSTRQPINLNVSQG